MRVSTMPRKTAVAAHQSGSCYKAISKQSEIHRSTCFSTFAMISSLPRRGQMLKFMTAHLEKH